MAEDRRNQRSSEDGPGDSRSSGGGRSPRGGSSSRGSRPQGGGSRPQSGGSSSSGRGQSSGRSSGGYKSSRDGERGGYNRSGDGQRRDDRGGYKGSRDGERGGYQGSRDGQRSGGYQGSRDGERGGYQGSRDGQRSGGYKGSSSGERGGYKGSSSSGDRGGYKGSRDGQRSGGYKGSSSGERGGYNRSGDGQRRDDRGGYKGSRDGQRRDDRGGYKGGRDDRRGGQGGDRPYSRPRRDDRNRDDVPRTAGQAVYDGPPLPDEITGRELDRNVIAQLKGLPEKLSARVARHLAAAQALIEEDPETAYQHTLAARARASRLAIVREAVGECAYAAGHYAEALSELRAAKRMNGATDYLAVMADCHRALGHPEQALKLAKSPSVKNFPSDAKAEMTIVEAGARRDMGQLDAALRTLELAPLMSKSREPWVVRLRYAYADTLVAAGRESDALMWFHRTYAIDSDQLTDAAERAEELEKKRD
ncbi:MAG: tetratricopeptide repeat protein [Nocardioides sp.]|uniref:tetratricopeptide repeat protein n=1 Tax=Nocardioides sp. TaxID=35761 RepID=UPI003F03A1A9